MIDWKTALPAFGLGAIIGFSFCYSPTADAQSPPRTPAKIEELATISCSHQSIATSKKWANEAARQEKDIRNSITASPEAKLLARLIVLTANDGFERLVMDCAIWKQGRAGI